MRDGLTTAFGLIAAMGTAAGAALLTYGYAKEAGFAFIVAAVAHAGHGYFTNKG